MCHDTAVYFQSDLRADEHTILKNITDDNGRQKDICEAAQKHLENVRRKSFQRFALKNHKNYHNYFA